MASRFPGIPGGDATASSTTPDFGTVGKLYEYEDDTYGWRTVMCVYVADAVAVTAGMSVEASTGGNGYVTPDRAGGTAVTGAVVGFAIGDIAAGSYGFIVCGFGNRVLALTDGSVAALGEPLVPHSSANGQLDVGSGEDVVAYAHAADSTPGNLVVATIVRGV